MSTIGRSMKSLHHIIHGDRIWAQALGYFIAYVPYTFLVKAATDGLLPGVPAVPGLVVLPASAVATLICMYLFVGAIGWWRYVDWFRIGGIPLPRIRPHAVVSGICMAVIVGATTIAYSFHGISVVFMLVLMKAGVLFVARAIDFITGRDVRWESVLAFLITFLALGVELAGQNSLVLSAPAIICIASYVMSYTVRFHAMHRLSSKGNGQDEMIRYFVEEQTVAMPALVVICALWALAGGGAAADLRAGFLLLGGGPALIPALLVGVFYAALYIFGTLIFLNPREYTFCVPINRATTVISGIAASYAIAILFSKAGPSARDIGGGAILIVALGVLAIPAIVAAIRSRRKALPSERLFLFVCAGNTARSPISQAICAWEMAARLGVTVGELKKEGITVMSAGLSARVGKPMKPEAIAALETIGVEPHDHIANQVTPELIARATLVCCMTEEQRAALLELAPDAASKIRRIGRDADLDEPVGHEATLAFAHRVRQLLAPQVAELLGREI
jgi:protein-tyrosine-phosphatase